MKKGNNCKKSPKRDNPRKLLVQFFQIFLNIIHIIIILWLFGFTLCVIVTDGATPSSGSIKDIWGYFRSATLTDVYTFLGATTIILFGIIGFYEYAYASPLQMLVPPAYIKLKERQNEEAAREMMKVYYEKDLDFIQQYEAERVKTVLAALKISGDQFQHVSYEIVRARSIMPKGNLFQLQEKANKMLLNKQFIQNLTALGDDRRKYRSANYYLDLYTAFYDSQLREDAARVMTAYITMCMDADALSKIDYIIIPSGSNLLMGLRVGELLGKKTVCLSETPRYDLQKPWDGEYIYNSEKGVNHILVLHDVLVSGERIGKVAETLPEKTFQLDGLFCLIKYRHKDYHPETHIVEKFGRGFPTSNIHCLLSVDENSLRRILSGEQGIDCFP